MKNTCKQTEWSGVEVLMGAGCGVLGADGGAPWPLSESNAMKISLHVKAGRMNTFWIRLDVFWELSQDENDLPVCQFSCQATPAVAPVSLMLMTINDTLSLHCGQLQGKATSTAPPYHVCLGHYQKDLCLPWCCWGAGHPFQQVARVIGDSRWLLPVATKALPFHMTPLPRMFVLYLWILSSSQKRDLVSLFMIFSMLSIQNTTSNKKANSHMYLFIQQICATVGVTQKSLIHYPVLASWVWEIKTFPNFDMTCGCKVVFLESGGTRLGSLIQYFLAVRPWTSCLFLQTLVSFYSPVSTRY